MARVKKIQKNELLADIVQRWASKYGFLAHPYISNLISSLRNNENLPMWSTVDPFELLPYPLSTRGNKIRRVSRVLTMWRNALVFAPVAFTWLAVGRATEAFKLYTDKNINATVNFLQFWQDGYGILNEKWRIGTVALLDASIVFIVIGLTIGITYSNIKIKDLNSQEEAYLLNERLEVAIAIKEYLYNKQTLSKLTLNQGVATAIENLVEVTEKLKGRRRRK